MGNINWHAINMCVVVREKLDEIVNTYNEKGGEEACQLLEKLSDDESKIMLKMIIMGDWKRFK